MKITRKDDGFVAVWTIEQQIDDEVVKVDLRRTDSPEELLSKIASFAVQLDESIHVQS